MVLSIVSPDSSTTYEDFLASYIQLEEESAQFSWLKADLLNTFSEEYGDKSLTVLSNDIKQPQSTIKNYARVAKAFPKDKRLPNASFTLHFKACFADKYDPKTREFVTSNRFDWLNRAIDEKWSTRRLEEEIQEERLSGTSESENTEVLDGKRILKEIFRQLHVWEKELPSSLAQIKALEGALLG